MATFTVGVPSKKPRVTCPHRHLQVILNPPEGVYASASSVSSRGDVVANVCVDCSQLTGDENVFGPMKYRNTGPKMSKVVLPYTKETLTWLRTCHFGSVTAIHKNGISIATRMSDMKLPKGSRKTHLRCSETIVIGRKPTPYTRKIPVSKACAAVQRVLKGEEVSETTEDPLDEEDEDDDEVDGVGDGDVVAPVAQSSSCSVPPPSVPYIDFTSQWTPRCTEDLVKMFELE
jgi:hypothetical protein